jgi:branched-chain amino acid transport system substrate-binding protein
VVRDKVDFLAGFGLTPEALAVAPIAQQANKPMIVMNAVTTGITAKSPYMLCTSVTMQQMTEPFGDRTAKNKIGKVYSLVTDYSTGIDAEARFTKGLRRAAARSSARQG